MKNVTLFVTEADDFEGSYIFLVDNETQLYATALVSAEVVRERGIAYLFTVLERLEKFLIKYLDSFN